jgi:hypothetical protein
MSSDKLGPASALLPVATDAVQADAIAENTDASGTKLMDTSDSEGLTKPVTKRAVSTRRATTLKLSTKPPADPIPAAAPAAPEEAIAVPVSTAVAVEAPAAAVAAKAPRKRAPSTKRASAPRAAAEAVIQAELALVAVPAQPAEPVAPSVTVKADAPPLEAPQMPAPAVVAETAPIAEIAAIAVETPNPVEAPAAELAPAAATTTRKRAPAAKRVSPAKRTKTAAGADLPAAATVVAEPVVEPLMITAEPTNPSADHAPALTAATEVAVAGVGSDAAAVAHRIHPVALGRKREVLQHLLTQTVGQPTLVFTRTKHGADKIARFLERCGLKAAAIHGDKSQGARNRALAGFQNGELSALVITDIAARVVDLQGLPTVINYDLPYVAEDYLQRIARTGGSAAAPGLAISIITQEESQQFRAVRDLINAPIELTTLEGFEAAEPFDPERDPPPKPEAAAPVPRPEQPRTEPNPRRDQGGRGRRDRRGRQIRGDAPTADAGTPPPDAVAVAAAPDAAVESLLQPGNQPRGERRPPRTDRNPRGDRQARPDRRPQPSAAPRPAPTDSDDDQPDWGNSLAAPPPSQLNLGGQQGRRRGRRDPFAPVVIDENRANIYDERQPDDYRDQWSVLGPDSGRPAWTYADSQHQPAPDGSVQAAPPRRSGPGGGPKPRGKHTGQGGRGPQRPRRAEGR